MSERKIDVTEYIINYEMGVLDDEDIVVLFQELINNGMAWTLQGSYGRMAQALIDEGYCTDPKQALDPEEIAFDIARQQGYDDVFEDDGGTFAPVCEEHKQGLIESGDVFRGTICGVEGCNNEATAIHNITEEDAK